MGWLLFACSIALLTLTAAQVGRRIGRDPLERFWLGIATAAGSIGAASVALSIGHHLTPISLLFFQVILFAITFALPQRTELAVTPRQKWGTPALIVIFVLAGMSLLTAVERFVLPISNIDDRNYRASRAAAWMQNSSIFAFETHNQRQVAFPPGGSMPFFYGILFTRGELAGSLVMWAAYPLVAIACFVLLRELRNSRVVALIGATIVCFTPIVLLQTRGVQPELWLTLFLLGCGFWCIRYRRDKTQLAIGMAALFAMFAIGVRTTVLPALIVVLVIAGNRRGIASAIAGALVGLIVTGLLTTTLSNIRMFGGPLGSPEFRHVHSADLSSQQIRTHLARSVVVLLEPPTAPASLQNALLAIDRAILRGVRADTALPMEEQPWPGQFAPDVKPWAENYSLIGLAAAVAVVCSLVLAFRRKRIDPNALLAILSTILFLAAVLMVRWMGVIGRFWVAPYALGAVVLIDLLARVSRGRIAIAFCVIVLIPAAIHRLELFRDAMTSSIEPAELDEPYYEPLAHMPANATIFLTAGQGTRDYPLYRPRDGFSNRVHSWGVHAFDASRMQALLQRNNPTHLIVEDDRQLTFQWNPAVDTAPFVAWVSANPDFREIPLPYTPHMRLFARRDVPDALR